MAVGQGYAFDTNTGTLVRIADGNLHAFDTNTGTLVPVKDAWAWDTNTNAWKQWYPHGGGGTTHTATAAARHTGTHYVWSISSSRHVLSQRFTIKAGTVAMRFTLNGHHVSLAAGHSHTITVSTSARSVSLTGLFGGSPASVYVRYTYR